MKVLAVDDVLTIRRFVRKVVESLGGDFLEASNGLEGLMVLEENAGNIDLILLDWNMPAMDGYEFLLKVKNNVNVNHIPVIMVTTENEREKIIKAVQAGASYYLVKPFTEQDLTKKIMDCLGLGYEYDLLSRCFSAAVCSVVSNMTRMELLESHISDDGILSQSDHISGQVLILGQINVIVWLDMNEETGSRIVAFQTGKPPSEVTKEELIEGLAGIIKSIATKTRALLAAINVPWHISTPFISVGVFAESRHLIEGKVFAISKKHCAGDLEVFLKMYCF